MIVIADQNMPMLDETFGAHATIRRRPGRSVSKADLHDADALLVRSVTRVDSSLLNDSTIRFVGSATIGKDHLDTAWLESRNIHWCNAPACNAQAAAEYTLGMLLLGLQRTGKSLSECTAGIIGRGNVGGQVLRLLESLGVSCVANDPPLADAGVVGLVSQAEALRQDLVCLHVPLTTDGPYPTWRMIGREAMARMKPGAVLLNAGRGEVIDGPALLAAIRYQTVYACLDVWPAEPDIDPALLSACTVATPHVAGYSVQGKTMGTFMVYQAFCRYFGLTPVMDELPQPPPMALGTREADDPLSTAVIRATGVARDDERMRAALAGPASGGTQAFDQLRKSYPDRHEFRFWRIDALDGHPARRLAALGFQFERA